MSLIKLNFISDRKRTEKQICKHDHLQFVIVPAFMEIEKMRRAVAKYAPTVLEVCDPFPFVLHLQYERLDGLSSGSITTIAKKAARRFPFYETFYLITKPEGIDLHSFAAWVDSLKP